MANVEVISALNCRCNDIRFLLAAGVLELDLISYSHVE